MAKRRPSGDGMVRKRDDGRWEGRIVVGHKENGDSIFLYVYADNQKELTAKLHQSIDAYHGIDLTEQSRITLTEWMDTWLEQMAVPLRPGTLEHYRRDMENHVKPRLGAKPLTQLTAADLRKLYDTLKRNGRMKPRCGQSPGLSSTTVHGIHTTLHHALKAARDQGLIPVNLADEVEPPKVIRQPMKILTEKQLDIFLTAIKADEFWYDFFYTELTTGLRRDEICGLKWENFDSKAGTLKICRTIRTEKGGALEAGDTKTYAGKRTILLPRSTIQLLQKRKETALTQWIFPDLLNPKKPTRPTDAYRQLKKLLAEAGLPSIRFHDFRHSYAVAAIKSGDDTKTVHENLGHATATFTLDVYGHVTAQMRRESASRMEQFIQSVSAG